VLYILLNGLKRRCNKTVQGYAAFRSFESAKIYECC